VNFGGTCNAAGKAISAVGSGSGAVITTSLAPSAVTAITVTAAGTGYIAAPTVTISGGGGTGATATAYLDNTLELTNQQNNPETVTAVACSTAETQSTTASQVLNFTLAKSQLSSCLTTSPAGVCALSAAGTGNISATGTLGVGQTILVSTPSNFVGQFIEANTGATPTNCSGASGGIAIALNALNGVANGGAAGTVCNTAGNPSPGLPACNSVILTVGTTAPLALAGLPTPGNTLALNTVACPETAPPNQVAAAALTSTLTFTASQPSISVCNQAGTAGSCSAATTGPVSVTEVNNVTLKVTDLTTGNEAVNICYRLDGSTPTCGVAPQAPGVCDPASTTINIPAGGGQSQLIAISTLPAPPAAVQFVAVACASASGGAALAASNTSSTNVLLQIAPVDAIQTSAPGICPLIVEVGLDCAATGTAGQLDQAGNPECTQTTLTEFGPTGEAATQAAGVPAGSGVVPKFGATICFAVDGTIPAPNCYQGAMVPADVSCFVSDNQGSQGTAAECPGNNPDMCTAAAVAAQVQAFCPVNTTCPAPSAETPGGAFVQGATTNGTTQWLQTIVGPGGAPPGGIDIGGTTPTDIKTQTCLNVAAVNTVSIAVGMNGAAAVLPEDPTPYSFTPATLSGNLTDFGNQEGAGIATGTDSVAMYANGNAAGSIALPGNPPAL